MSSMPPLLVYSPCRTARLGSARLRSARLGSARINNFQSPIINKALTVFKASPEDESVCPSEE